jgi:hypothetical protein
MSPSLWLTSLPTWGSATLVIVIPTVLAMSTCAWIRRYISLEKLSFNNEVAGFKFAVLGVMYAVLIGFVVVVVWEKFHDAEAAVEQQSGKLSTLYRLSNGLAPQHRAAMRRALDAYIESAIASEWPALARGGASADTTHKIDDLYAATMSAPAGDQRQAVLLTEMLGQLNDLTEARRTCIVLAGGAVPGVMWAALLLGGVATVGFTFFFGTHNLGAQVVMTGLLSFVLFLMLWVVVAVNHPFAGPVSATFEPLDDVLRNVAHGSSIRQ